MKFGVWIPSYCYPEMDYGRAQREVGDFSRKANDYGIDLWVIDHLLHAHGLYGMTWLEPMSVLTWAGAARAGREARHRHPGAAAAQPGAAREGDRDPRLPLGRPLRVRGRPGLVPGGVLVDRHRA